MTTYWELNARIAEYQHGEIDALQLAEWACKEASVLPDMFDAQLSLAALSFFLERICEQGPTFPYTFDQSAFDALTAQVSDALNRKQPWIETLSQAVTGEGFLRATPASLGHRIRSALGLIQIEPNQLYNVNVVIRIFGEEIELRNVSIC